MRLKCLQLLVLSYELSTWCWEGCPGHTGSQECSSHLGRSSGPPMNGGSSHASITSISKDPSEGRIILTLADMCLLLATKQMAVYSKQRGGR